MTPPALAAQRFCMALGVGAVLGVFYGFLRPLRPRLKHLTDGLFVLAAFLGWIQLSFGLCKGDLRLGYTLGMLLGILLWELTLGRLLRPVWRLLWTVVGQILRFIFLPVEKMWKFSIKICKKLLATAKKWFTIVWTSSRRSKQKQGGSADDRKKKRHRAHSLSQEQPNGEGRDSGGGRIVYHHAGDPAGQH